MLEKAKTKPCPLGRDPAGIQSLSHCRCQVVFHKDPRAPVQAPVCSTRQELALRACSFSPSASEFGLSESPELAPIFCFKRSCQFG